MKFLKVIAVLTTVTLAAISCQKQSTEDCGLTRISAYCDQQTSVKTVLSDLSILWSPGDKINLFTSTDNAMFTATNTAPAAQTDFVGKINFVLGTNPDQTIYALYPYSKDASISDGAISTIFKSHQLAVDNSFGKGNMMSVAKSEEWSLKFYNVCGGIKFSLSQEGVKGVVFKSAAGESLSGKIKIVVENENIPTVSEITEAADSLVLYAPEGKTFKTGTSYYISALPCTLSGFTISLYTASKSASRTATKGMTIKRSNIISLGVIDNGLSYKEDPMASLFEKVNTTDFEW